jgi:Flp pilus assembly pilin Flp
VVLAGRAFPRFVASQVCWVKFRGSKGCALRHTPFLALISASDETSSPDSVSLLIRPELIFGTKRQEFDALVCRIMGAESGRRTRGANMNFRRLWRHDEGQDIAEYAVMLAVILVMVVGTIRLVGSNANTVFSNAASSIQ